MRSLLILVTCLGSIGASAQQNATPQPAPAKGWDTVRALPLGAALDIKLRHGGQKCTFSSADADSLVCSHGTSLTLQRADVLQIKIHHRGRSTLIAMGIGAGTGAVVGAATSGCSTTEKNSFFGCFLTPTRPQGAAIGALLFGIIGAPIGALTDFSRSIVYKAP